MAKDDFIKLPRLYVDEELTADAAVPLNGPQTHYLKNVLRRAAGDPVRLFNGRNGEWLCALTDLGKKGGTVTVNQRLHDQPPQGRAVHLLFAPIKKARMDFLIEKAVELGATHIHPVLTRNTEIRHLNEDRIRAQIAEAAEQCERLTIPAFSSPQSLENLLGSWKNPPICACIERTDAAPLTASLKQGEDIAFLIGPEGGFTEEEKEKMAKSPLLRPVSLGPSILRSETAAITALALSGTL